jgi:hypothetical protein
VFDEKSLVLTPKERQDNRNHSNRTEVDVVFDEKSLVLTPKERQDNRNHSNRTELPVVFQLDSPFSHELLRSLRGGFKSSEFFF